MTGRARRVPASARTVTLGCLSVVFIAAVSILLQPRWLVDAIARSSPRVVYFVETTEPLLALTVDDGPDAETTPRLLQLLNRHGARATFFMIGDRIAGNEALLQRMVAEGHEIANHMARERPSIFLDPGEFETALVQTDSLLSRFGDPHWARPGSGWYSDTMLSIMERHGYRCVLGSIYPYDGTLRLKRYTVSHVLRRARRGSIIVLHDGDERGERTIAALEEILPELARRGLRVVTLSELIASGEKTHSSPGD